MKKTTILTVLVVFSSLFLQAQVNPLSVFVNGDIECTYGANQLCWWYTQVNGGMGAAGTIALETTDVHAGSNSIKAVTTAVASPSQPWCVQLVSDNSATGFYNLPRYKPDGVTIQYYTLRFWAKSDAARPVNMLVQDNSYAAGAFTTRTLTTSWDQYAFNFDIPASFGLSYNFKPAFHLGYEPGTYYFDDFELGVVENFAVLPLELIGFQANENTKKQSVDLNWQTVSEERLSNYEIQRSADGKIFESIQVVKAKNTMASMDYAFQDETPLKGMNYYRLKMNEQDGSFNYSRVQVAQVGKKKEIVIYPNPSSTFFALNNAENIESINVFDVNGRMVQSFSDVNAATFDVSNLPYGIYQVAIKANGILTTSKLVKL